MTWRIRRSSRADQTHESTIHICGHPERRQQFHAKVARPTPTSFTPSRQRRSSSSLLTNACLCSANIPSLAVSAAPAASSVASLAAALRASLNRASASRNPVRSAEASCREESSSCRAGAGGGVVVSGQGLGIGGWRTAFSKTIDGYGIG